mmetsp:Transcript_21719/g.53544  ORF Transcript_21719/g.53544 Transcript_21719/m.53544 type:complete len:240 (+) Transcript_21719:200-919(+)
MTALLRLYTSCCMPVDISYQHSATGEIACTGRCGFILLCLIEYKSGQGAPHGGQRAPHGGEGGLDEELLDLVLEGLDLPLELRALVGRHRGGDNGARHTARAAERLLGGHEHVGHVLVLAQEGKVQQDLERFRVGGHHDELGDAAVQRLGRLVGALLELLVVARLLHQLEDGDGQVGAREGEGLGVHISISHLSVCCCLIELVSGCLVLVWGVSLLERLGHNLTEQQERSVEHRVWVTY